ncbi:subtilisin-like protein [Coniochaeta sp. PMI_546]|nr:subtilisin-like protein [Coniochaeta sp. PMI_546]
MKNLIRAAAIAWLALGGLGKPAAPPSLNAASPIANHFVVQYHPDVSAADRAKHEDLIHAAAARHTSYRGIMKKFDFGGFQGYHVEIDAKSVAELQKSKLIKQIQPDAQISIASPIKPPPPLPMLHPETKRDGNDPNSNLPANIRRVPISTWGQARLSHRVPNASGFLYDVGGSTAYIIDTGIRTTHSEFLVPNGTLSRAVWGTNLIPGSADTDENGHGTHCAGTVGGRTKGVAPLTELVAVKVFDANGNGPWSGVLGALDWVVRHAAANGRVGRAVVNMSLGGSRWGVIEDAVTAAVNAGVAVVVAAGNSGQPVNTTSPAACPDAITVGAIDESDARPYWSNWGVGLDFFAPGADVESAWIQSDEAYATESGTSMAAPHVTGLVAYLMQQFGPHTPQQVRDRLNGFATRGTVTDAGDGSTNAIVYNGNEMFLS